MAQQKKLFFISMLTFFGHFTFLSVGLIVLLALYLFFFRGSLLFWCFIGGVLKRKTQTGRVQSSQLSQQQANWGSKLSSNVCKNTFWS
jgi:hypothetical protein